MERYLENSAYIDWEHPQIRSVAFELKGKRNSDVEIAKSCFEYVRDSIKHSWDYKIDTITCKASDVLKHKTGYCYAKSHLLAALLRANNIPAGLCYQRLTVEGNKPPCCLHGLNAVFLKDFGWYRVDPRGNKEGVNACFSPPKEQLAFNIVEEFESDIEGVWPEPLKVVIGTLTNYHTSEEVYNNLPDINFLEI